LLLLRNPGDDAQGGITNSSAQKGTVVPGCPSSIFQPCLAPATVGLKLSAILDLKGGEAGEEKLERSLERAGHRPLGSYWSEVP